MRCLTMSSFHCCNCLRKLRVKRGIVRCTICLRHFCDECLNEWDGENDPSFEPSFDVDNPVVICTRGKNDEYVSIGCDRCEYRTLKLNGDVVDYAKSQVTREKSG